jgi:hypothetical protein
MEEEVVAVQIGLRDAGRGVFESIFITGEEKRLIESTRSNKKDSGSHNLALDVRVIEKSRPLRNIVREASCAAAMVPGDEQA